MSAPDTTWNRMDAAADVMAEVAGELEAVAALVGQRARQAEPTGAPGLELSEREAQGFAQVLALIAGQLRQAEGALRPEDLAQTG